MKKKEIYFGEVTERVDFPNKAKVCVYDAPDPEDNGSIITVKNVMPGEKIRFRLKKKGVGDFVELVENSPYERGTQCHLFRICGGCVYQPLDYEKQLEIKTAGVKRLIEGVFEKVEECPAFDITVPSPKTENYRNKMEYSFGDAFKDGPLTLGLHRRGSRFDVVTTDECLLVHEDCNRILKRALDFFSKEGIDHYRKMDGMGVLRHLVLRRSDASGEVLVTLVTTSNEKVTEKLLSDFVTAICETPLEGNITGILHTRNDSVADVVKDEGTALLYGKDYITEEILGLKFKITPFSFFQTNSKGAEKLYEKAREYAISGGISKIKEIVCADGAGASGSGYRDVTDRPVIFDLYSGTGTIAQIMAPVAKRVYGVEIVEEAVVAARENSKLNGLDNCEYIAGDVLKVIDGIEEKPDFIILDPPRDGVHPKALEKILAYGVENILYISCKPTSLARDLEICRAAGYEVARIGCVDMFPGTGHVETVVLMSRVGGR